MKHLLALLLFGVLAFPGEAAARSIEIPLQLDFALLQQLLRQQVYTEADGSARVWRDVSGCNSLTLRDPQVDALGARVRTRSAGVARVGTVIGETCVGVMDWEGTVELFHQPLLVRGTSVVRFRLLDSNIYDAEGRKGLATGVLWDWVKAYVHPRFDRLRVDLTPVFDDVRTLLPLVLSRHEAGRIERTLASMAIEQAQATPEGLRVSLRFDIPELAEAEGPPAPEPALTPEEVARWEAAWQQWDGFLTFVIRHVAADTPANELRLALREVLLDARYDLREALMASTPGVGDPVPALFVKAWEELAAVLRRIGDSLPADAALRYLAFISAADALRAINQVGPATGVEISADALRKLARIMAPQDTRDPLEYSLEVDPTLRELLGFGPPLPPPEPNPDLEILLWLWRPAFAAGAVDASLVKRLNGWVPEPDKLEAYLPLVKDLLDQTARISARELQQTYYALYRWLVFATAWQESCWRQFIKRGGRIVPLRSRAGAVGLMQVSPTVWRGFYEPKGLQRDIGYNAGAGSEILRHYLVDHAIQKGEHTVTGKLENLARATYAAYNGGPRHLVRYRKPGTPRSLRRIDTAFWEKYQTVRRGDKLAVAQCFGKQLSGIEPRLRDPMERVAEAVSWTGRETRSR